jgi:hypothetical protein
MPLTYTDGVTCAPQVLPNLVNHFKSSVTFRQISARLSSYRIANVMTFRRANCDGLKVQVFQHILRLDTDAFLRQLCETFVRIQTRFRRGRRVIVPRLIGVQRQCVRPEFRGIDPLDGEGGFVSQSRGGMPGLDLVTENEADRRMIFLESRKKALKELMRSLLESCTLQSLSIIILLQGQT